MSLISWPNTSNPGLKCVAEHSRAVRKVIQKVINSKFSWTTLYDLTKKKCSHSWFICSQKFIPILERYKTAFPLDCPFHASRDIYGRKREGPELEGESSRLVCWICGLAFGNDEKLQNHYEENHIDSLILVKYLFSWEYMQVINCLRHFSFSLAHAPNLHHHFHIIISLLTSSLNGFARPSITFVFYNSKKEQSALQTTAP